MVEPIPNSLDVKKAILVAISLKLAENRETFQSGILTSDGWIFRHIFFTTYARKLSATFGMKEKQGQDNTYFYLIRQKNSFPSCHHRWGH